MQKNSNYSLPTDLAYIIHGVVIAQGFFEIAKNIFNNDVKLGIAKLFIIIVSILDWHIFYYIDKERERQKINYPLLMWVIDYLILGTLAAIFILTPEKHIYFKICSFALTLEYIKICSCVLICEYIIWWVLFRKKIFPSISFISIFCLVLLIYILPILYSIIIIQLDTFCSIQILIGLVIIIVQFCSAYRLHEEIQKSKKNGGN